MRRFLALIAIIALLVGTWYFASPYYALHQLRQAARDGDTEQLAERVDFAALRQSLTGELQAEIDSRAANKGDLFERIGTRLAGAAVEPVVDAIVTPEGVARLVSEGRVGPVVVMQPDAGGDAGNAGEMPHVVRHGIDGFSASEATGENGPALLFERAGLGWRLVGVTL